MIVTEFLEGQGLGNQLWVYAAGRSLAEHAGVPHAVLGWERFKGEAFLELATPRGDVPGTDAIPVYRERLYFDPELDHLGCDFDPGVIALQSARLSGLFQSERYFFGEPARVRRYVQLRPGLEQPALIEPDVCVLNLRGGEYKRHRSLILPESYWRDAMRHMTARTGVSRFVVVTDDPRYARSLFPDLPVVPGGVAACYSALYHARRAILSNTSFAYFPVKTGVPKELVIAPLHWARFGHPSRRWASPANAYGEWWWQDAAGELHAPEVARASADATAERYRREFTVVTSPDLVMPPPLRAVVPRPVRQAAKRALSWVFPTRFG